MDIRQEVVVSGALTQGVALVLQTCLGHLDGRFAAAGGTPDNRRHLALKTASFGTWRGIATDQRKAFQNGAWR